MRLRAKYVGLSAALVVSLTTLLAFQNCAKSLPKEVPNSTASLSSQASQTAVLTFNMDKLEYVAGGTVALAALGGKPPYTYSIVNGNGVIDSAGQFIAPTTVGRVVLRVTDSAKAYAEIPLSIAAPLQVSIPAPGRVFPGRPVQLVATGGYAPYVFTLASGTAALSATGLLAQQGTVLSNVVVRVTDSRANIADLPVCICAEPSSTLAYAAAGAFTYTVPPDVSKIQVKAWGGGGGSGSGGGGGFAQGTFTVVPGQQITVHVAGPGANPGDYSSGGGGGASAAVIGARVLVVAGGGGGGGYAQGGAGGPAGAAGDGHSTSGGGAGASQSAGGAGGAGCGGAGAAGGLLTAGGGGQRNGGCTSVGGGAGGGTGYVAGGEGGAWGGACYVYGGTAGGGGGGYYSGGGGGGGCSPAAGGGAGGGGSNFVEASAAGIRSLAGAGAAAANAGDAQYAGSAGNASIAGRVVINAGQNITP
jgi:hypothetical protein